MKKGMVMRMRMNQVLLKTVVKVLHSLFKTKTLLLVLTDKARIADEIAREILFGRSYKQKARIKKIKRRRFNQ